MEIREPETIAELRLKYELQRSQLMQLDRKISYYQKRLKAATEKRNHNSEKSIAKILIKLGSHFEKINSDNWKIQQRLTLLKLNHDNNIK